MTKAEWAMIPPGSAGCQPGAFGSLPNASLHHSLGSARALACTFRCLAEKKVQPTQRRHLREGAKLSTRGACTPQSADERDNYSQRPRDRSGK